MSNSENESGGDRYQASRSDFNQRDENVSFFPHNHLPATLTDSQKEFLNYE
jgi:hypothetical protein